MDSAALQTLLQPALCLRLKLYPGPAQCCDSVCCSLLQAACGDLLCMMPLLASSGQQGTSVHMECSQLWFACHRSSASFALANSGSVLELSGRGLVRCESSTGFFSQKLLLPLPSQSKHCHVNPVQSFQVKLSKE